FRPVSNLADFVKECKDKKLRSFSSYKTKKELGEVLRKYRINSNDKKDSAIRTRACENQ
ncbi:10951_t:CDS:1, partial [Funneliformis caledonium]